MRNFIARKLSKILLIFWCVSPISYADISCNDACTALDLNNDNVQEAQIDGILFVRHMFGLTQDLLIKDLDIGNDAFNRISKTIHSMGDALDIDGNGEIDALTDGLILYRYMSGERGSRLVEGVVAPNAERSSADQIEVYLESLSQ
tara:strand:- start:255 stop:692 length:438 start_codon:yes stop_codon:yes gene_type:complete